MNLGNESAFLVRRTVSLGDGQSYFIMVPLKLQTKETINAFSMWTSVSREATANHPVITTPDTSIAVIFLEVKHDKNCYWFKHQDLAAFL